MDKIVGDMSGKHTGYVLTDQAMLTVVQRPFVICDAIRDGSCYRRKKSYYTKCRMYFYFYSGLDTQVLTVGLRIQTNSIKIKHSDRVRLPDPQQMQIKGKNITKTKSVKQTACVSRTFEMFVIEKSLSDREWKILNVHCAHDGIFHDVDHYKCCSHFTIDR